MPYKGEFIPEGESPGTGMIETGHVKEAAKLLNSVEGEKQLRLLLELGTYYLYKPGTVPSDLDSALYFTEAATKLCSGAEMEKWQYESLTLTGKIYYQKNQLNESQKYFMQVLNACQKTKQQKDLAIACENIGMYLPYQDTLKLKYLNQSLGIYQYLGMKEKQLEVLSPIIGVYFITDWSVAEEKLEQYLSLQKTSGFRHLLYTQYSLSYLESVKGSFLNALSLMNSAFENMRLTGDSALSGLFYSRMGSTYQLMEQDDEAIYWYGKALATRYSQPELFWYKSFFSLTSMLADKKRAKEGLALINAVSAPFPPTTTFDSMYLYYVTALCYDALNIDQQAEKNYMAFLSLARHFPPQHVHAELPDCYNRIARFYYKKGNIELSRYYLDKAMTANRSRISVANADRNYWLLYQLDSASGNYKAALENHKKYKYYNDSFISISQRKQMAELMIKYDAENKDKNISLLKQKEKLQQVELQRATLIRNITLAGLGLLLIILALLFNQYRLKQRTNNVIASKNKALERMVNEKEWLLKEVHHRVKNNLQTVVSLLELQGEYLDNEALSAIHDSQNRVYTMSLIHQKLYQTENVASIGMHTYLPELAYHLSEVFNAGRKINFHFKVIPLELDVSQAVPVGLIVNEAVTNSIKYAFTASPGSHEISISMQEISQGQAELVIADNGIGLPPGFDDDNSRGLGFKLMKGLVEDIDGQISIESKNGTIIRVRFTANIPLYDAGKKPEQQKMQTV